MKTMNHALLKQVLDCTTQYIFLAIAYTITIGILAWTRYESGKFKWAKKIKSTGT